MPRRGADEAQIVTAVPAYVNTAKVIISRRPQTEEDLIKDSDIVNEGERMSLKQWQEAGANVDWLLKCKNLVEDGYVEVTTIDSGNKSDD